MIAGLCNHLWALSGTQETLAFHLAAAQPEETQKSVLRRILRRNARTAFGRAHGFDEIDDWKDFQQKVPLASWEDLVPSIERMTRGEADVLVPGLPLRFEPTSGSTSASKLIPYTGDLRGEFQAGLAPWIFDLLLHAPHALRGKAYWSVSPASFDEQKTEGGIPVGFEDDTEYLAPWMQGLVRRAIAVPALVSRIPSIEDFRYVTLAFLLAAEDLSLVSVWNPTFLSLLLAPLKEWAPSLLDDLEAGHLSRPLPPPLHDRLNRLLGKHPRRARELRKIFERPENLPERIWPRLSLISCWMDAAASGPAEALRELFPHVRLAPKGLLATEGMISFPLLEQGSVLSLRSHFFEFLPEGGVALPAWKLQKGERYEVVLTTGGGLYRYRMGDVVEVTGFYRKCPVLRFLGRSRVSDFYGEKLNEAHVSDIVRALFENFDNLEKPPDFALLAPAGTPPERYMLYFGGPQKPERLSALSAPLEQRLRENVHYAYCRDLGQLKEATVCWVGSDAYERYQRVFLERGVKAGDIKPSPLDRQAIWETVFARERPGE